LIEALSFELAPDVADAGPPIPIPCLAFPLPQFVGSVKNSAVPAGEGKADDLA